MKKPVMLRPFDYGAIALALAITVLVSFSVYGGSSDEVLITGNGGRWIFPLNAAETVTVEGPLGDTVVELRDGSARVLASPCTNQICVAAGTIRSHGQWIACLPNQVLVSVTAGNIQETDELDGASW
jgi:hypothetical protein